MSPHYSTVRLTWLLSVAECASAFGVTPRTVERQLARRGEAAHSELIPEKRADGRGGKKVRYIDPSTLGWPMTAQMALAHATGVGHSILPPTPATDTQSCDRQEESNPTSTTETAPTAALTRILQPTPTLSVTGPLRPTGGELGLNVAPPIAIGDLQAAEELHGRLSPVFRTTPRTAERRKALREVAESQEVHEVTVRRWVRAYEEQGGLVGLARVMGKLPRADKGTHRLPLALIQIVRVVLVSNPASMSVRKAHQIVCRAVPDLAMVPRKNGRVVQISVATVQAIKAEMQADPHLRLLFADADARKEHLRTYSGEVLAEFANQMWQMDMTRCDIMIYDPVLKKIYRPRVQAVIDVYSGAIMALSFSQREDQDQADLVLARALAQKQGPLARLWPMHGIPKTLYIDNGKTYKSAHFHRIVGGVGTTIIHSRPLVSHTRGKIERWFGTLHAMERALRGYCGPNAASRSNAELKRLYKRTLKWAEAGADPSVQDRLLTLSEYQEVVLRWLVTDYHETVVHGRKRVEHWVETAPASTRVAIDPNELKLLFGRWEERRVTSNGTVTINNTVWTTPSGRLAQYQGQYVQVIREPFALGEARLEAAWRDRSGRMHLLGELVPAPTAAASLEAAAQRRANREATREQFALVDGIRDELFNPAATYQAHLTRALPDVIVPAALPAATARLGALSQEAPVRADVDTFTNFLRPSDDTDLDALLDQISED